MTTTTWTPRTGGDLRAPVRRRSPVAAAIALVVIGADLGAVLALGLAKLPPDLELPGGLATWGGQMTGLLAEVLILGTVLLSARVPLLERSFGQDRLLRWHRWVAPGAIVALAAHPLLLAVGATGSYWSALWQLGSANLNAVVGTAVFLVAAGTSIRALRTRLPYEGWHLLHVLTYGAVILAFVHQLDNGSSVLSGTVVRTWWLAQIVVVLAAAATYRIGLPLLSSLRHDLRVTRVRQEAPGVVTVVVGGRDVHRLGAQGGQFLVWRFLDAQRWWHGHPFSLSASPSGNELRLTAQEVGAGTRSLRHLRPGTRLLVEGPYGVLTDSARRTNRVLLVGAGLGISPLRALLEDLPPSVDVVVVQRSSTPEQAVLHGELLELARRHPHANVHLVTGPRGPAEDPGRLLGQQHLRSLVPDIATREAYLCGPPALLEDLAATLSGLGVPDHHVHVESFVL